jgi:hypothetical protein
MNTQAGRHGRWAVRQGDRKLIRARGKMFPGKLSDLHPEMKNYAAEKPDLLTR